MDQPKVIVSNPGSDYEEILAMRLTETGDQEFYVKGKTNVYEKIQMFKDDCDLEKILQRCTDTGDITLLNQRNPLFIDMEDYPENIFEAHRKIKEAENTFNELPLETREKYDFSFDKFLADFGTETWLKNMGLYNEEVKEEIYEQKGEEKTE